MKVSETDQLHTRPLPRPLPWRLDITAYRTLTRLAQPAAGMVLRYRARHGKEEASRRNERLGAPTMQRPAGDLAWFHAASVGEANAVLPLIASLRRARPALTILLTTGTVTSAAFVAGRKPAGVLHQYVPLDTPAFVDRFLTHWRPAVAIFTEQEIWPNLLLESARRGIPLALVNARMSDRSFARWERRAGLARALFSRFTVIAAQNGLLSSRFQALGAPSVIACGNLKIDAPPLPVDAAARAVLEAALGDRPRLVAASTHPGEDEMIADAHRRIRERAPGLITILAPRHPERGSAISGMLTGLGFRVARRSEGALPDAATDVYLADTIGELGLLYAIAPVSFIGGSLVRHGGQNPIEAVRLGSAVVTGPHWYNFADAYRALIDAGAAVEVATSSALAEVVSALLTEPARLAAQRRHAEHALDRLSGALDRTLACLLPLIPETARSPTGAD